MAAIADADASIDVNGNIRWTGAATTNRHSILEFIQWMMKLQDDGVAAGDDILDITVDTPFDRSTDQIVTLNSPFNIDDSFAAHLYDGSVSQTDPTYGGETLYSGLRLIGPVVALTEYMIIQNGKVLPAFWGVGINPETAPSLVFSRHLVKAKFAGSQIDGQRITVLARELGDQFRRFPVTLGAGNAVAAIGNGADIFNETADATIAAWVIVNTEGFQELNLDGTGAAGQEYYSKWAPTVPTQSINDAYEYTKQISQRAHQADVTTGTATGTDYIVDNATILGQGQSFIPLTVSGAEKIVEVRMNVKVGSGTPTGTLYCELLDSNDGGVGVALPTGAALARSADVLASAITSTYEEVIFRFDRKNPATGADQAGGLDIGNAEYFIAIRHDDGGAGDYFHVEGEGAGVDATQGHAVDTSGTWGGASNFDIYCEVKSCPAIHGIPGEQMQGINVEVGYDGEGGAGILEDDICFWGTTITYDTGTTALWPGEPCTIRADAGEDAATPIKTGGIVLYDDATNKIVIALDSPSAAVINDNDVIEGLHSGFTCAINVAGGAIEDEDLGGGTALVLALDDNAGTGEIYLQILTGVQPVENNRIRSATTPLTNLVDATAVLNSKTISPEFVGTSTGSNIIGAYGIGFHPDDIASPDRFTDLSDAPRVAQNNVLFTVSGLVSGEDRVLVGPRLVAALDRGQWLVSTALTLLTETALVVKTGTDTVPFPDAEENWPDSGTGANVSRLRIERDDGIYQLIPYDSHDGTATFTLGTPVSAAVQLDVVLAAGTITRASGSFITDGFEQGARFTGSLFVNGGNNADFTVDSVTALVITVVDNTGMVDETGGGDEVLTGIGWDFSDATDGVAPSGWDSSQSAVNQNAFMCFIDVLASGTSASFQGVHGGTDRDLFVRVRDGGGTPTKTFQSTAAQFLSTPQTVASIRTSDA